MIQTPVGFVTSSVDMRIFGVLNGFSTSTVHRGHYHSGVRILSMERLERNFCGKLNFLMDRPPGSFFQPGGSAQLNQSKVAFRVMSVPARALETGQFSFAFSAYS